MRRCHTYNKLTLSIRKSTWTDLTLLPLRLPVLLPVFEGSKTGDSVRWKYTLLGRSAVSDWVERFL